MSYILNIKVNNLIQLVNSLVVGTVTNPLTSTIIGANFNINNVNTVGLVNIGDSTSTYSGTPNLVTGTVGQVLLKNNNNSLVWSGVNLSQVFYVDPVKGSDTNGFGSILAPFKTITFALSRCTNTTLHYTVYLAPGTYSAANEGSIITYSAGSANVAIIGMTETIGNTGSSTETTGNTALSGYKGVEINTNFSITLSNSAGVNNEQNFIISLNNLYFNTSNATQLRISGSGFSVYTNNCIFNVNVTANYSSSTIQFTSTQPTTRLYMNNTTIFATNTGSFTVSASLVNLTSGILYECNNCNFQNSIGFNNLFNISGNSSINNAVLSTFTAFNNGNAITYNGATLLRTSNFNNCKFTTNYTTTSTYGISFLGASNSTLIVSGCTFINNSPTFNSTVSFINITVSSGLTVITNNNNYNTISTTQQTFTPINQVSTYTNKVYYGYETCYNFNTTNNNAITAPLGSAVYQMLIYPLSTLSGNLDANGFNISNIGSLSAQNILDSTASSGTSGQLLLKNSSNSLIWSGNNLSQVFYVDPVKGSDTSGFGSILTPFKTITFALSKCTDITFHYSIYLAPGVYSEGSIITYSAGSANVAIIGMTETTGNTALSGYKGVEMNSNFYITLSNSAGVNNEQNFIISLNNLYFNTSNATQLRISGSGFSVYTNNCIFNVNVTANYSSSTIQLVSTQPTTRLYMNNTTIFATNTGSFTVSASLVNLTTGILYECNNCNFQNSIGFSSLFTISANGSINNAVLSTFTAFSNSNAITYNGTTLLRTSNFNNCKFTTNYTTTSTYGISFGGASNSTLIISGCTFINNSPTFNSTVSFINITVSSGLTVTINNNNYNTISTTQQTFTPINQVSTYTNKVYYGNETCYNFNTTNNNVITAPLGTAIYQMLSYPYPLSTLSGNLNANGFNISNVGNLSSTTITTPQINSSITPSDSSNIQLSAGNTGSVSLGTYSGTSNALVNSLKVSAGNVLVDNNAVLQIKNVNGTTNPSVSLQSGNITSDYSLYLPPGNATATGSPLISNARGDITYGQPILTTSNVQFGRVQPTNILDTNASTGTANQLLVKNGSNALVWASALTPLSVVFYVDGVNGLNTNNGSAYAPFQTIQYAVNQCSQITYYYTIYIAPNNTQTSGVLSGYTENVTVSGSLSSRINFIGMGSTNSTNTSGLLSNKGVQISGKFTINLTLATSNESQNLISINNLTLQSVSVSENAISLLGSGYSVFINNCFIYSPNATVPVFSASSASTLSVNPRIYLTGCSISNGNGINNPTYPSPPYLKIGYTANTQCVSITGFNVVELNFCNINHSASSGVAMLIQNQTGQVNGSQLQTMNGTTISNNYGSTALSYATTTTTALLGAIIDSNISHRPVNSTDPAVSMGNGATGGLFNTLILSFRYNNFTNNNVLVYSNPFIRCGSFCNITSINNLFNTYQSTAQAFVPYATTGTGSFLSYSACVYANAFSGTNTVTYPASGFTISVLKNDINGGGGGGGISSVVTNSTAYPASTTSGAVTVSAPDQLVNTGSNTTFGTLTLTPTSGVSNIYSSSTYASDGSSLVVYSGQTSFGSVSLKSQYVYLCGQPAGTSYCLINGGDIAFQQSSLFTASISTASDNFDPEDPDLNSGIMTIYPQGIRSVLKLRSNSTQFLTNTNSLIGTINSSGLSINSISATGNVGASTLSATSITANSVTSASSTDLTLNAPTAGKTIKFQVSGTDILSVSSGSATITSKSFTLTGGSTGEPTLNIYNTTNYTALSSSATSNYNMYLPTGLPTVNNSPLVSDTFGQLSYGQPLLTVSTYIWYKSYATTSPSPTTYQAISTGFSTLNTGIQANQTSFLNYSTATLTSSNWTPIWGNTSSTYGYLYFPSKGVYSIVWSFGFADPIIYIATINKNWLLSNWSASIPPNDGTMIACLSLSPQATYNNSISATVTIETPGTGGDYISLSIYNFSNATTLQSNNFRNPLIITKLS